MKHSLALVCLIALANCGADGEPVQPSVNTSVSAGSNGVSARTGVTVKKGLFSLGWGIGL